MVEKSKKKSPHLALTHKELQGGSANGRNLSLLMKSDVEITEDIAELIEKVTGVKVEVTKASYEAISEALRREVRDKYESDDDWAWVVDFDDTNVVFSNDKGMFYTTYTLNGGSVTIGETATEVTRLVSYVEGENKIVLSNNLDGLEASVYSLIVKSFDSISKNEKLVSVLKSKNIKGNKMDEIQKAVDTATASLKEQLEKANTDLQEAVARVEAFEKAAKDQKDASRKERVEEVIKDSAEAEAFLKSVEVLDDTAFDTVLKTMVAKADILENGDLFTKQTEKEDVVKGDTIPRHEQILREKYNKQ